MIQAGCRDSESMSADKYFHRVQAKVFATRWVESIVSAVQVVGGPERGYRS